MRLVSWCLEAALLFALSVGPSDAGEYRLLQLGGTAVKWGAPALGTGATITYALAARSQRFDGARNCRSINPLEAIAGEMAIPLSRLVGELVHALAAWEKVADVRFRRVADQARANILIGAQAEPRGRAFANVMPAHDGVSERAAGSRSRLAGFTAGSGAAAGEREPLKVTPIERSLVCLNPRSDWKIGFRGDGDAYDLRYTFMHEIGHAIGLDHPGPTGELMSFRYEEGFRAPQPGDIAGATALYGPLPDRE